MIEHHPTAFISYSWDDHNHENWVVSFANRLRSDGVDAMLDKFLLQTSTVNFNHMMIDHIMKSEYVIIILTENYATKANQRQGGVGFETSLMIPQLKTNKDKVILIMRHKGDYTKVFPYHMQDYYAIDFTDDDSYETKFSELLHRIYKVCKVKIAPLGPIPKLDDQQAGPVSNSREDLLITFSTTNYKKESFKPIPNISLNKEVTDKGKDYLGYRFVHDIDKEKFDSKTILPGTNGPCPCESGKRYYKCCGAFD